MNVFVSNEIYAVCPEFKGMMVEARVVNSPYNERLWQKIESARDMKNFLSIDSIKSWKPIAATRRVYKACGKDPSRYRPAAEALLRRLLQGKELYKVDTLVDLLNYASITTGYSLGGFDTSKFVGDILTLGIGRHDEPYVGIGRGTLNIEGLPVYRDALGGVGTPTSDSERTKIDLSTTRLTVLINGYDGDSIALEHCATLIATLAADFASATDISIKRFLKQ